MRISDWSSDVCSSGLQIFDRRNAHAANHVEHQEGEESEADEQEAIFGRPADLIVEIDWLDENNLGVRSLGRGNDRLQPVPEAPIGRASCRERVCQYGYIPGDAG